MRQRPGQGCPPDGPSGVRRIPLKSKRLCFIGMNNYGAGREAGKLVKEAVPEGGKVMIFVGRLEQLNALQRRQGVIDELLDRPVQKLAGLKTDPPGFKEKGATYEIVGTRTDNFDKANAKSNAEDAMVAHPDLVCMVGLFAYNPSDLDLIGRDRRLGPPVTGCGESECLSCITTERRPARERSGWC